MESTFVFLVAYILFRGFMICMSSQNQQSVPPGFCYRAKFSVNEDVVSNHALEGHVFKRSTADAVTQCHVMCRDDCRCLSMNYIHINEQDNCELNDANEQMNPAALKYRFGADYYDFVREFTKTY
ncbi:hypothetical protein OS493_022197 [Desmophyllum pertusum]|uniref:Apple domain-containing protein n=1 Tax=Desmophyllum pertusum TaxID=174260 RepID=A0A9W9YAT7_9CNID|nr:hypothetical protein OS493_022197 [Desmophyllum pertusum]